MVPLVSLYASYFDLNTYFNYYSLLTFPYTTLAAVHVVHLLKLVLVSEIEDEFSGFQSFSKYLS